MVDDDGGDPDTAQAVQRRQAVPRLPGASGTAGVLRRPVSIDVLLRRPLHHPPPRKTPGGDIWFRFDRPFPSFALPLPLLTGSTFLVVV